MEDSKTTSLVTNTDADTVQYLEGLVQEAQAIRSREERRWDQNFRRVYGDQWDKKAPEGLKQFTLNLTQNAIIATVAVQTEQRPRVRITPRETSEDGLVYLKPAAAQMLASMGLQLTPDEMSGMMPISQEATELVTANFGALSEQDAYVVNDAVVAEVLTKILETLWDRADTDFHLIQNVMNTSVIGHQAMLCQWDAGTNSYQLMNIHQMNGWIDPISTGIHDAEYFVWDQVVSAEAAKATWPEHAALIDSVKQTGSIGNAQASGFIAQIGAPYRDVTFERPMVRVQTAWLRNYRVPIPLDEALQSGAVTVAMVDQPDPATGQVAPTQVDETYMLPTGELTAPDNENWPHKTIIRQVQRILDTVISDVECPYRDIPIGWNINIPIMYSPYGQGEPDRLEDLQQNVNRVFSILHNHLQYYQSPMEVMPQSVKDALKESERQTFAHPGRQISVPDELFTMFGGNVSSIMPMPQLPTSYVQYAAQLIDIFKYISGNVDVLSGQAKSDWSGELVKALQGSARGPISFKSTNTERMIRRITQLVLGCILDLMPESEWAKIVTKYPPHVLKAIRDRAKVFDHDIIVEVASGKGVVKQVENEKYLALYDRKALDVLTLLEKLEVPNAEMIVKRLGLQASAQAMAGAAAGGHADGQQDQQGQAAPKKEQNSRPSGSGG